MVLQLQAEVTQLRQQQQQEHPPTTVINNTVINNNVTNNIQVNALGKENISYITEAPNYTSFMKKCIKDRADGVCNFLIRKHFHEEHPENHNVCKRFRKGEFINVFDGKEWRPKMVNDTLTNLFAGIERQFSAFVDLVAENKEVNRDCLEAFTKEVGIPLDWDLSSQNFEYDHEMLPQQQKEVLRSKLFKLALEHITQYSKKRDIKGC